VLRTGRNSAPRTAQPIDAEFIAVDTPPEVMRGADVILCGTDANMPFFQSAWIEPGQQIVTVERSNGAPGEAAGSKRANARARDTTARVCQSRIGEIR
jgi:ornithine cyclodeaminase/alanine dehydrogenase-like protein (mu-crystallin family)